jgi:DNA-binding MarR family transcriptional regulator
MIDPDQRTLGFMRALWALDHALHRTSKRMAATIGVTGPQRLVIRVIGRQPSITAGELARTLHLHPSTVTGVLARLEGAGMVKRQADAADRRRMRLVLTPRGRRVYLSAAGTVEEAIERALTRLNPRDAEAAIRALDALTAALGQNNSG